MGLFNISSLTTKKFIAYIFIFSIVRCVILFLLLEVMATPDIQAGYAPDSKMYETLAKNIISGRGFSSDTNPPFLPMMLKEPVYPVFIALISSIFGFSALNGINGVNIIIAQILINPATVLLVYFIAREICHENTARLAALSICLIPTFGELSFFILAETLYTPILLFFMYVLLKAFNSGLPAYYFYSGLLLGLCAVTRVISLYFCAVVLLFIAFGYGKGLLFSFRFRLRQRFKKMLIFLIGVSLLVLPWIIRNGLIFRSYQVTTKGGLTMWVRGTIAESFTPEEFKAYLLYMFSGRLAQKKYPDFIGKDLGSFEYRFVNYAPIKELNKKGLSEGEVDAVLAKEGIRKALRHPFKTMIFSSIGYLQVYKSFVPGSLLIYTPRNRILREYIYPGIRLIFGFPFGFMVIFMSIAGIYLHRGEIIKYLPVISLIVYYHFMLFFITASPGGVQSFITPVTPFYFIFAALFISVKTDRGMLRA